MDKLQYLSLIFPLFWLFIFIRIFIRALISRKKAKEEAENLEKTNETYPTDAVSAQIISKYSQTKQEYVYRYFRNKEEYFVVFQAESNKQIKLKVPKDFYLKCAEGSKGLLVTVNGEFIDFQ